MKVAAIPQHARLGSYQRQVRALLQALQRGDLAALRWLRQFHPNLPGRPDTNDRNQVTEAQLRAVPVRLSDAQHLLARLHCFRHWEEFRNHLRALRRPTADVSRFEQAVTAVVSGRETTLGKLLRQCPSLVRARSTREHGATLLHYVSANAVEPYHQKTPKNAPRIAELLLQAGAEVDADLDYGDRRFTYPERIGSTTLGLVATSCHPAAAGVQLQLLDVLIEHGASVDGLSGGWNPLIAALHNGRGEAAAHLAARGAALDLEAAAGVGDLTQLRRLLRQKRRGDGNVASRLKLGFLWACQYGHGQVIPFLLDNGVAVDARPRGETGLHWAAYKGHPGVIEMLLQRNASPNILDEHFNGTPLEWALYGWSENARPRSDFHRSVALLAQAGGTARREWLASPARGHPVLQQIKSDRRMRTALVGAVSDL